MTSTLPTVDALDPKKKVVRVIVGGARARVWHASTNYTIFFESHPIVVVCWFCFLCAGGVMSSTNDSPYVPVKESSSSSTNVTLPSPSPPTTITTTKHPNLDDHHDP